MPTFTATNAAVTLAPLELITSAFIKAGVIDAFEVPETRDAAYGLEELQRLLDTTNALRGMVYSVGFQLFNLQANHSPHTIGPAGDFQLPARPIDVISASFILNPNSANPIDRPITIRDDDWWAGNSLKSLTSSIITDLYYSPDMPLGNLFFYPICNTVAPVRLEFWTALTQAINLVAKIAFPQAYWEFILTSLAMRLGSDYGKEPSPTLVATNRAAQKIILDNNADAPRVVTNSGMPGSREPGRPGFNFLTGMRE